MKQKKFNIVFLGRYDDVYSKKIISYLKKKKNLRLIVILSSDKNIQTRLKKLHKSKIDFIFSFRSKFILSSKIIDKTKYSCINFHPGPPEFRGLGCVNNAIFTKSSFYGLTAHLIDEYINHGPIIDVERFSILPSDSVEKILDKTYKKQIVQFKFVIKNVLKDPDIIDKFIFKFKKEKWSKKLLNKKQLNKLYLLDKDISKKKIFIKFKRHSNKKI